MPFGRSLLQKKSLLRVSGKERSPEILISFHSSGLTSNQWRNLKNPYVSPTCIPYLVEKASNRMDFLPSLDSMDQDLLLLYGQYRSTLVDHMDVKKEELYRFNLGIPPKQLRPESQIGQEERV
ncbi:hypothetical protein M9H77_31092 [Catharanthus roseus]|uniref:Uncharacterized protein n=1 Tax=Catharanthus roseus TaxID=4058 RepID=A0ACB9ZZ24_CATRO|nr:hypothetical protein M9H77_31092 [Catharanthus roseus]